MRKHRFVQWFAENVRALPAGCVFGLVTLCLIASIGVNAAVKENSINRAQRELIAVERLHGNQSAQAAAALSDWLEVAFADYWHEGHADETVVNARRLVALRADLDGEQSLPFAHALQFLGFAHSAKFEHEQAAQAFERAAEIVSQPQSSADLRVNAWASVLRGLGRRNLRKDLPLAEKDVRRGLEDESSLTPVQRATAWLALAGIAVLQRRPEVSDEALAHAEAALHSAKLARHPLHADIKRYRSLLSIDRGDPGAALSFAQAAVNAAEGAEPISPSLRFISVYNLGQIEQRLGHFDEAARWFERAAQLPETATLNGGYSKAMLQYSVCSNLLHRKRFAEAEAPCRDAAERFEKFPTPLLVEASNAWNNVGVSLRDRRREADAIEPFQKSLRLAEQAGPEFVLWTHTVLQNLADIHLHRGEYIDANRLLQKRVSLLGETGDFSQTNRRSAWRGLAAAHWGLGDVEQAFAYASQAELSAARVRRISAADLDEERALQLTDHVKGGLDWMLPLAAQSDDQAKLAMTWEASMQAFGMQTIMAARRLRVARASADPSLKSVWSQWKKHSNTLTQTRIAAARSNDEQTRSTLDAAERSFEAVDQTLARRTGGEAAYAARPHLRMSEVRAALPEGASLVRFVLAPYSAPQDYAARSGVLNSRLVALVSESSAPLRIVDLGAEAVVAESANRWYTLATRPDSDEALVSRVSQKLWRQLWRPLALQSSRVFVVSGVSALARINFVALQDAQGRYLVELGQSVHLLNHEYDLLRTPRRSEATDLLLVGAPDFAARSQMERRQGACTGRLSALPGATKELEALSAIADLGGTAHSTLSGEAANEARLLQAIPGKSILHFATHGIHLKPNCRFGPDPARGVVVTAGVEANETSTDDLSALALSTVGTDSTGTANDGLLTSTEITTLDLTGVEWAVLSACETALGPSLSHEGVGGLRRALGLAGAHSIIMSLWRVDDLATVEFMEALYRQRLVEHASTDQAMQAATERTLRMRRQRGESVAPYYWAGFVASGDWR